eukprot:TRINITY_DN81893_c0_g1_i1.p1 TRINITY_DN81893_c0_g1~~TRINITY_DN81893_c0_g1_i1.p1  ORF type:complete len:492 (+),score=143.48 TRINITY_DN81893_c0_g1_i1:25-1476(+)
MGGKKSLRETYRLLIEAVYAKWNADKKDDVPMLMDKYREQEAEIYDRIVRKYVFCRERKDWQPLIEAMYARFNPDKLANLDGLYKKYKDSEAALYRALCDKYLPTLHADPSGQPLLINVWGPPNGSEDKLPTKPAPAAEETGTAVEASIAVEDVADADAGRTPPRLDALDERANQPGAAEVAAMAEAVQVEEKDPKKEKKEKKKRKKSADEEVPPAAAPEEMPAAAGEEAYPPPLPRRRKRDRESMAGVMDDIVPAPTPEVAATPLAASGERSSRHSRDASLRPKAAPKPTPLDRTAEEVLAAVLAESEVQKEEPAAVPKKKRHKSHTGAAEGDGAEGRRRKRRRKVPVEAAQEQASAQAPEALPGAGVTAGAEAPPASQTQPLEMRAQVLREKLPQLKEKLLALKTQIKEQEKPPPQRAPAPWNEAAEASEYSYSDEEQEFSWGPPAPAAPGPEAENRTVHLRNALEAKLRAQLLQSGLRKV